MGEKETNLKGGERRVGRKRKRGMKKEVERIGEESGGEERERTS